MARPAHGDRRAVADITIGLAQSMQKRRALDEDMGFVETEQQFHVAISGTAATAWAFSEVEVEFDYHFAYAPGQRDSDLDEPHMTYGSKMSADVAVTAHVRSYTRDEETGLFTGAMIRIGTAASASLAYSGVVHLTFQGFAIPADSDESL